MLGVEGEIKIYSIGGEGWKWIVSGRVQIKHHENSHKEQKIKQNNSASNIQNKYTCQSIFIQGWFL